MNNEETVLDPQYSAESKVNAENNTASNDTKKSKGNGIAGKVGAATVGVAAGVAGTMYADDLKAAVLPNSDAQTEHSPEEQPTSEPVSTSNQEPTSANHTNPHATPTSNQSSNHEPNQNHTVEVVDVAQEDVNGDGQLDDAALINVDGEAMVIADIDHDGEADVLMRDVNGNGQVDKEDILDVRAEHIAMPNHAEATQTSLPDDGDVEVHVLHVGQADLNGDGIINEMDYNYGWYFNCENGSAFFPAAARYDGSYAMLMGSVSGIWGSYWSCNVRESSLFDGGASVALSFMKQEQLLTVSATASAAKADAYSVRCVRE